MERNDSRPAVRYIATMLAAVLVALLTTACEQPLDVPIEVTSVLDAVDAAPGDGVCETVTPGECTLRAAVQEANALPAGQRAVIALQPGAVYPIDVVGDDDLAAMGDFDVLGDVRIDGHGATIDAKQTARILDVHPGARLVAADVTLDRAWTSPPGYTVVDTPVEGGSVLNRGAVVELERSRIRRSRGADGGSAIHQVAGSTTLTDVTVDSSPAGSDQAVIWVEAGSIAVVRSALSRNAPTSGFLSFRSRILRQEAGTAGIVDSSILFNQSSGEFCGMFCNTWTATYDAIDTDGEATLVRSTVVGNGWGLTGSGSIGIGGSVVDSCATAATTLGYNVVGSGDCLTSPLLSDEIQTDPATLQPFSPSSLFEFPTFAGPLVPLAGSTALVDRIPWGTAVLCDHLLPVDQRGQPRPSGPACDVGAVERQPTEP